MKSIEIPQDLNERNSRGAAIARKCKASAFASFAFVILLILCLVGSLVCLVLTEIGERNENTKTLLYILSGSFLGGTLLFGFVAVCFSKLLQSLRQTELDYRERCDGENSFFVGEGTLATFEEDSLYLHEEDGAGKTVIIPYSELRFFSVCTRHAPRAKGEWSVVIEIPVKFLSKETPEDGERPIYVQTDAKDRLYRCLEEKGLTLLGENRDARKGNKAEVKKFKRLKRFKFQGKNNGRKNTLMLLGLGVVLVGAGFGIAFWHMTVGTVIGVCGAIIVGRAFISFLGKQSALSVYEEGLYWKEGTGDFHAGTRGVFLKWEEIRSVKPVKQKGTDLLQVTCDYGSYYFLNKEGAFEYLRQLRPETCAE